MPLISSRKIADGICFCNNIVRDDHRRKWSVSPFPLIDQVSTINPHFGLLSTVPKYSPAMIALHTSWIPLMDTIEMSLGDRPAVLIA